MDQRALVQSLRALDTSGLSRRQLLGLAAAAAMAVPLASCAGDQRRTRQDNAGAGTSSTAAAPVDKDRPANATWPYDEAEKLFHSLDWPKTNVPEPTSKVTVTMAITSSEDAEIRHAQFAKFFMQQHPNIELKREISPWGDFLTKYMTQAAGGSLPDLMYSHYSWGQNLIEKGIFAPIDDYIADTPDFHQEDFTPTALTYWQKDGKLYGVPTDSAPKMLYYNKDMFAKAGIEVPDSSWTWDKLRAVAIELTSGKGVSKKFGFTPMPVPFPDLTTLFLLPYGGRFLSEDETKVMIHEEAARDALRPWVELQVKHAAVPSLAELQALENADPYRTNRAAMAVNGVWILSDMVNLPEQDRFEWGLTDVPTGPAGRFTPAVGSAFGLTTKAKNPEAAWIVLNAFLSSAGHRFFLQMPPSRLSTFEENLGAIKADAKVIADSKKALQEYATADGVLKRPATQKIVDTAKPVWDRVRAGSVSLDDGLAQIRDRLTPIVKDNA